MACLRFVKLSLSNAQVASLSTTPIEIVANPGAGKAVQIVGGFARIVFAGSAFTNNPNLYIRNPSATAPQAICGQLINATASLGRCLLTNFITAGTDVQQIVANEKLEVFLTANPTGGGGSSLNVYIWYRIINA